MKKLPIGIQDFTYIIENDYSYVDKTELIYILITTGKYYFLSRPRRFGKSLLISTLAALFSGKKELFKNLAIASLPYDWKQYSVLILSLSDVPTANPEVFEQGIKTYLKRKAQEYSIRLDENAFVGEMLRELVVQLSKTSPVVLLIDEYDYPILEYITNTSAAEKMRDILKSLYIVIKGLDPYLKFVLLVGVSKFAKSFIFSGLNNLNDITFDPNYDQLLGFTQEEIIHSFYPYLEKISREKSYAIDVLLKDMQLWYNGYRFSKREDYRRLHNPFSVLLFLSKGEFDSYWPEAGTPPFLISIMKENNYPILGLNNIKISEKDLGFFDINNINIDTLLFQTGYLTVQSYDKEALVYTLVYPNKECTRSFINYFA